MAKESKADVEMKDASTPDSAANEKDGSDPEPKKDPDLLTVEGKICEHCLGL